MSAAVAECPDEAVSVMPAMQRKRRRVTLKHDALPAQQKFWSDDSRFRAFIGGIGSGKTRAGCLEILRMPGGSDGMVVAPTYPMLRDSTLAVFLKYYRPFIKSFNVSSMTMELQNDTKILWRTADDADRLRGPNLSWFWMDEGALCSSAVWDVLIGRLRLSPGRGWITTNPRGFDWVYQLFEKDRKPGYSLIHAKTAENTFNPPEYLEALKSKYSSAYAMQELDGLFVDLTGARVKREWVREATPPAGLEAVMGIDPAVGQKDENDFTAAIVGARAPDGKFWVLDARRMKGSLQQIIDFIGAMAAEWDCQYIAVESVQAQEWLCQELWRTTSLPVREVKPRGDKLARFVPLEARYEQGLIWHRPGLSNEFTDELLSFTGKDGEGKHDDFIDAEVYAFQISSQMNMGVE